MTHLALDDYPGRYSLSNELHARPFPELSAPCRAAFLAIKQPVNAAGRDRAADFDHLIALLDRYGAPHPAPGSNHYSGNLGRGFLKWEMHTEFVTYSLFSDGVSDSPFSAKMFGLFPQEWLKAAPGNLVSSCIVRVEIAEADDLETRIDALGPLFVHESLAVCRVLDGAACVGTDFRIDENGHNRFLVLSAPGVSRRRLGRIVQRLLEIETYKSMAMLALPEARQVAGEVARLDTELSEIVEAMAEESGREADTLKRLLRISAEVEKLASNSAFRFGAAEAYEAIVNQRIEVLREDRIGGRQLMSEFMMRRFDPAMRTCRSAKERLGELSIRAARAANLLRTRVDVANQEQNTLVLRQMDRRAAMQLHLQKTVEGLSVVAISYYAVNLVANIFVPVSESIGLDKTQLMALVTIPVVFLVWFMVRRIRASVTAHEAKTEA